MKKTEEQEEHPFVYMCQEAGGALLVFALVFLGLYITYILGNVMDGYCWHHGRSCYPEYHNDQTGETR